MNKNEALQWLIKSISRWPDISDTEIPKPMFGRWVRNTFTDTIELWGGSNINREKLTRDDWIQAMNFKPFVSVEDAQLQTVECKSSTEHSKPVDPVKLNYKSLSEVLDRAYHQASEGKGSERHGQDLPFTEQPMQLIQDLVGESFALGQAMKKMQESQRLPHGAAIRELLGAINYIAGAIIHKEQHHD